jgi:acyl-CoA synthetase (AMP-forming)/AMP-acid ligase II
MSLSLRNQEEINNLINYKDPKAVALIDSDKKTEIKYDELFNRIQKNCKRLNSDKKKLCFLFLDNSAESIVLYLSVFYSGNAQFLADASLNSELKEQLIQNYKPDIILDLNTLSISEYSEKDKLGRFNFYSNNKPAEKSIIYDALAVLLSTSGTTGSPKLVRLSYKNIISNASSIASYLNLNDTECPITSLPINYSYGLSVINSHLYSGAKIVCTNKSMIDRGFWNVFNEYQCTSFAGVPYNYQILYRLKFHQMNLPSLRTFTQAGGKLSEILIKYFYDASLLKRAKFFVMYGQTEATARISFVPYEKLGNKIGSIGIPIPGGQLKINLEDHSGKEGELVYEGLNVMLGYATTRDCLSKSDELNGILYTGDIAYKDSDGYYFITGRKKRFLKILGLRINLDEIEKLLENEYKCSFALIGNDEKIFIVYDNNCTSSKDELVTQISSKYKLHHSILVTKKIDALPFTSSGKKNYEFLKQKFNLN